MNRKKQNPKMIHETVVRDIIDIVTDIKDMDEVEFLTRKNKSFRSIAQASSNLILVFPVPITRSISIENAAMVTKAIERQAVSMLQILFSALSVTNAEDAMEYVGKFHKNIKTGSMSIDDFIDDMNYFISKESVMINKESYDKITNDLRNLSYFLSENINENSLENFKIKNEQVYLLEADDDNNAIRMQSQQMSALKNLSDINKNDRDYLRNQLLDNDVKKTNELVPTSMIIQFVQKDKNGGSAIITQAVIGVKAKMYPVDSTDIMNRILVKNSDHNILQKFIKASTREISFCRDFLFAIDKAKIDALSQSKRGSSSAMWKVLERRSIKSSINRKLRRTNDASAISTLVISQQEVEMIKKTEGIDLENPRVMRPIMESYNLMGICIVDETMEVAKFMFDTGTDMYETVSFSHLEREGNDSSSRKIINLMTKIAR